MLFQTYKMHLLHMHQNAKSVDGRELNLMKVISESLRFIAEKALEKLQEQVGKVIATKIRWVLTVPALWSEEHKHFMRKAAVQAGIVEELNSSNLLLCLEPEGASIQCREDSEDGLKNQMIKGTTVMVLDCGGGTVDITIHKLTSNPDEKFLCEELLPSSGGCEWGSKYVDLYFEQFLADFFGDELYNVYKQNAMARLDILKHFEMLKRKFNPGVEERSRLQLSYLGEELSASRLGELVKEFNKKHEVTNHIKQRGASSIDLTGPLMTSFFKPLFDNIKTKVKQLIDQAEQKSSPVNFIFMVGGFSESPFLKSEIKKAFEEVDGDQQPIQVLVPRRP